MSSPPPPSLSPLSASIERLAQSIASDVEPTDNLKLVLSLVWVVRFVYARYSVEALTLAQYSSSAESDELHWRLMADVMMSCSNGHLLQPQSNQTAPLYAAKDFYVLGQRLYTVDNDTHHRQSQSLSPSPLINVNKRAYVRKNEAIWFIDSLRAYDALEADLLDVARHNYQRNGYFCLVYTGAETNRLDTVRRIFQRLSLLYVVNVNVFLARQRVPFVYTYFPYSEQLCHRAEPQLLHSFSSITRNMSAFRMPFAFFPSKVANMHGCTLHVVAVEVAPFVHVDRNASSSGGGGGGAVQRLHGIEGLVLAIIAQRMNFTLSVQVTNDRGVVYSDGSATGASATVIAGRANLTIGVYMNDQRRTEYMQPTFSYMSSPLLVAVSRGEQLTPLQRLAKPFGWRIWCLIGGALLLAACAIVALRLARRAAIGEAVLGRVPFTNLLNTLLGGNLHGMLPRGGYARYLLMLWLLLALVLRNAYQGELYIMLQDSRALSGVRSLQEAVERNYTIYSRYTVARIMRHAAPGARIHVLNATLSTNSILERVQAGEKRLAVPVLLQLMRLSNIRARRTGRRIDVLPDKLITVAVTFYLRRHSFLLNNFDSLLQRINAAGLITMFEAMYVDRDLDRVRSQQQPTQLSIDLLAGLFVIYAGLLTLSVGVFLLELVSVRVAPLAYVIHIFDF